MLLVSIYLRCVGKIMALSPCFRKLVVKGAPTTQAGTWGLLSGWEGFPRLSPLLSPPHMAGAPIETIPQVLFPGS